MNDEQVIGAKFTTLHRYMPEAYIEHGTIQIRMIINAKGAWINANDHAQYAEEKYQTIKNLINQRDTWKYQYESTSNDLEKENDRLRAQILEFENSATLKYMQQTSKALKSAQEHIATLHRMIDKELTLDDRERAIELLGNIHVKWSKTRTFIDDLAGD